MTELDNSVKTITFENIRFYVVKKLNDFYISRREVYKFFNRKTSVSLNSLFRIKSNYLGIVDKIEDAGFVIKDNGKEEKLSNTFLKIKDLIDVIKFYSKNNLKYSQKFSKFKNYLEFINLQFNMLGEKFYTDLDVFYRLKCKSDNSLEYYYIAKGLQGINKNNRLINVFQSSNGDLRVEIEQLIDNLEWYSTVKDKRESDFANKAISIKGEFSDSQGDCYLDSNTIIRPIKYVTFTGLEKFFFNRLSKFYPAYRKWYESVVYPNFPNSNKVKKFNENTVKFELPNQIVKPLGGVLMKDDLIKKDNKKENNYSIVLEKEVYEDINQLYNSIGLKSENKSKDEFVNYLIKYSLRLVKESLESIDKEISDLENKLLKVKSLKAEKINKLLDK